MTPLWDELYDAHSKELLGYGIRMYGSRELAEDLMQETFLKALMNADLLEDLSPSQRRAWLFRTYKHLFLDRYRRSLKESDCLKHWQPDAAVDKGLQEMENALVLTSINPQDRALFQLRHFDGYTAEEIARMMNLPPGTVRSRLSRCRKKLQQQLW